ncbi:MAG: hypothetical protein MUP30_06185 [Deltaproteobacteria bacterium]|nr:hypothetical protein [Deltaproteobacteria bacterium]
MKSTFCVLSLFIVIAIGSNFTCIQATNSAELQSQKGTQAVGSKEQEIDSAVLSHYRARYPEVENYYTKHKSLNLYDAKDGLFRISLKRRSDNYVAYIIKGGYGSGFASRDVYSKLLLTIADSTNKRVIADFDLRHKYYGSSTFMRERLDFIKRNDGDYLVFYQTRYGGDGDHSENRLKIFLFRNGILTELADENIHGVKINQQDNNILITGNHVITLCNVCDGWEESYPPDIFQIPVVITVLKDQIQRSCALSNKEKEEVIKRFNQREKASLAEQTKYKGSERYESYLNKITEDFYSVIGVISGVGPR